MTWWEGLPGMDVRMPLLPGQRNWADRAVALACAARLTARPEADARGNVHVGVDRFRHAQHWRADSLMRLLEPKSRQVGTDMDGYNRRYSLCMAVEMLGPGAGERDVTKLFEENYRYLALVPA
jgi:hypothetical protein